MSPFAFDLFRLLAPDVLPLRTALLTRVHGLAIPVLGGVTTSSSSTLVNDAGLLSTVTESTVKPRRSRSNRDRSCVAAALMVVDARIDPSPVVVSISKE